MKESYTLDFTVEEELKDHKDPLPKGTTMKNFLYKDFKKFLLYNIHDVFLLKRLEEKNKDLALLWTLQTVTRTRVGKVMVKTTSLKNLQRVFYRSQGYTIGNNLNASYGGNGAERESFEGGFVADPNLLDSVGFEIFEGKKSNKIFENVIDQDLSAMYPSIIVALNIEKPTQLGMLLDENNKPFTSIPRSLAANEITCSGKRLLGLPDISEVLDFLKKEN
jgi:DNA polymerase elongation subunit (family B)